MANAHLFSFTITKANENSPNPQEGVFDYINPTDVFEVIKDI